MAAEGWSPEAAGPVPLVSVVMPAFEAEGTLARAVASVRAQTLPDWELLIVDDGSRDGTGALALALAAADPRIRALSLPENRGAAAARNAAIRAARGRLIAFLDADDEWLPPKLARQTALMAARGAALSYTGFWREGPRGRRAVRVPEAVDHARLLHGNTIGCLTAIYDAGTLGKVEMPPLRLRQDYATWLAILRRGGTACGLPEPLAVHHEGPRTLSSGKLRAAAATWRLYRGQEGLTRRAAALALASHLGRRVGN